MTAHSNFSTLYLSAIVQGKKKKAWRVIEKAKKNGWNLKEVYSQILGHACQLADEMWLRGEINIDDAKYLSTSVTEHMMKLRKEIEKPVVASGKVLVCSFSSDEEDSTLFWIADHFSLRGWELLHVEKAPPLETIERISKEEEIDAIAIVIKKIQDLSYIHELMLLLEASGKKPMFIVGGIAAFKNKEVLLSMGIDAVVLSIEELDVFLSDRGNKGRTPASAEAVQEKIGRHIKKLRNDNSLTQSQLAKAAGIDRTYLAMIERGRRNITITSMVKIASALNIPFHSLVQP